MQNYTPSTYYAEISKRCNLSKNTVQKVWEEAIELIIENARVYGEIRMPLLGRVVCKTVEEKNMKVPNSEYDKIRLNTTATHRLEHIAETSKVNIILSEGFRDRFTKGTPTKKEKQKYKEELRAEQIKKEILEKEEIKRQLEIKKKEITQERYQKMLMLKDLKNLEPELYERLMEVPGMDITRRKGSGNTSNRGKKKTEKVEEVVVEENEIKEDVSTQEEAVATQDEFGYDI